MTLVQRLDHVNITVSDLRAVTAFFVTLGLEPDGDPRIAEGHWLEEVIGIDGARVELVMLRAPGDGASLELSQFHHPDHGHRPEAATADQLGLRSIAFEVDDVEAAVARIREDGFELVRNLATYEDVFKLCYVCGPEGIIVMLAQRLS